MLDQLDDFPLITVAGKTGRLVAGEDVGDRIIVFVRSNIRRFKIVAEKYRFIGILQDIGGTIFAINCLPRNFLLPPYTGLYVDGCGDEEVDPNFFQQDRRRSSDQAQVDLATAMASCQAVAPDLFESCVFDYQATGNETLAVQTGEQVAESEQEVDETGEEFQFSTGGSGSSSSGIGLPAIIGISVAGALVLLLALAMFKRSRSKSRRSTNPWVHPSSASIEA